VSYFRKAISSLLKVPDTPERTAFAFAVGVFIGFSPFLGLHTVMGMALAVLCRLNKIALMLGVWSNVPWLLIPFYSFATWVGIKLLGLPGGIAIPEVGLSDLLQADFWVWLGSQWRLLIPMFWGSMLITTVMALLAYPAALLVIRRYRGAPPKLQC
jgi:uncharacterized protein (DUF2062 family)